VNEIAARIEVSDADVQAAYDERYADFTPATEYNASHILVETEEEAQEIIDILATGADFAEMAKLKSTGPTGPSGGELGWFGPGRMVPEFENAVVQLEQGQVSPPVQTQYGWHVIRLNDSRQPGIPTLEQVRGELTQEVWNTALEGEIRVLVDSVPVDRADVSGFDPMLAGDLSLLKE
jgi:peptidyl-prolyl cis-trans isomerase C